MTPSAPHQLPHRGRSHGSRYGVHIPRARGLGVPARRAARLHSARKTHRECSYRVVRAAVLAFDPPANPPAVAAPNTPATSGGFRRSRRETRVRADPPSSVLENAAIEPPGGYDR